MNDLIPIAYIAEIRPGSVYAKDCLNCGKSHWVICIRAAGEHTHEGKECDAAAAGWHVVACSEFTCFARAVSEGRLFRLGDDAPVGTDEAKDLRTTKEKA